MKGVFLIKDKIILVSLFYLVSGYLFAESTTIELTPEQIQNIDKYMSEYAEKNNLPKPDGGITITDKTPKGLSPEMINKNNLMNRQMKLQGYANSNTTTPRWLENIKISTKSDIIKNKFNTNPYDTNLKANAFDIKLAFPFIGLSNVSPVDVTGFGASGSWVKNPEGWTGIAEIFSNKNLGICNYIINNMTLVHGSAQIHKENARYDISDIPNTINVEQGDNSAFLYSIRWYSYHYNNNLYSHTLECTTKTYDPKTTKHLISLANEIEKSI